MRSLIAAISLACILAFSFNADAQAKGRHHRVHHRSHHHASHHVHYSDGRPSAWCGWFLGRLLGMPDRALWLAANWAGVGHSSGGPRVGAIVVWRHHVGLITGKSGNQWVVKSGNDGHRVRERPRSVAGAIAFRSLS